MTASVGLVEGGDQAKRKKDSWTWTTVLKLWQEGSISELNVNKNTIIHF